MPPALCPQWSVPTHALQINKFGDGTDGRRIVLLATHPANPYIGDVSPNPDDLEESLQWLAHCYLEQLELKFTAKFNSYLPATWMDALRPSPGPGPHPVVWWPLRQAQALASQDLRRGDDPATGDQTIVMVAGIHLGKVIPSGFGVRIVMRRLSQGGTKFAVTSMTAHLPSAEYSDVISGQALGHRPTGAELEVLRSYQEIWGAKFFLSKLQFFANTAGQEKNTMSLAEVRFLKRDPQNDPTAVSVELVTYGRKKEPKWAKDHTAPISTTSGFNAVVTRYEEIESAVSIESSTTQRVNEWPLYSNATEQVPVFAQEPTSDKDLPVPPYEYILRPSHEIDGDDDPREMVPVPEVLKDDERNAFEIRRCPDFVEEDEGKSNPYKVVLPPNGKIHPRSNLQSAISAYYHFFRFFDQVKELGIDVKSLLRGITLPVQVHYRSGIAPGRGKDGITVNGRVALVNQDGLTPFNPSTAHVHLALANLNRWHRNVPDTGAFAVRPAEPLGFASSKRWVLHEIGHVLISGALGELEFRFSHSLGDALAAVLSDPDSRIPRSLRDGPWADFRYQTFPWIFTTRRHDRTVLTGWSWSGTMHRDVLHTPELQLRTFKGYGTEQILSTTIFRLYRILGGDTVKLADGMPDVARRRKASRIVLYLMARATESFVHWPLRAEELESAMIDADVCLTSRLTSDVGEIWTGGQAHKAIRWSFEAQGMHPADASGINNGIGAPPPVDVYIKDQRDGLEHTFAGTIDHGPGTYVPVSLHWARTAGWTGGTLSMASPGIVFGNRGNENPGTVTLRAWFGLWFGGNIIWLSLTLPNADVSAHINGGAISLTGLGLVLTAGPSMADPLLLLEITCENDRANTDPQTEHHCKVPTGSAPPTGIREVIDLVASDNNLALFWLDL